MIKSFVFSVTILSAFSLSALGANQSTEVPDFGVEEYAPNFSRWAPYEKPADSAISALAQERSGMYSGVDQIGRQGRVQFKFL